MKKIRNKQKWPILFIDIKLSFILTVVGWTGSGISYWLEMTNFIFSWGISVLVCFKILFYGGILIKSKWLQKFSSDIVFELTFYFTFLSDIELIKIFIQRLAICGWQICFNKRQIYKFVSVALKYLLFFLIFGISSSTFIDFLQHFFIYLFGWDIAIGVFTLNFRHFQLFRWFFFVSNSMRRFFLTRQEFCYKLFL